MAALGRRRSGLGCTTSVILALVFFFASSASAAVLGIDFGTLNLKAALVKPGIPLEIVLSKDSKRKEAAVVGFKPNRDSKNTIVAELGSFPERVYGADALALQGRIPGEVFPNLKPLLGLTTSRDNNAPLQTYKDRYPAIVFSADDTPHIKSNAFHESEEPWGVEELLAMELANIKHNAENMAGKGNSVENAVITVPAFYTAQEKGAIERAATLAGLNVMGLVSDGLAVGLDYAKSRTFPSVSEGGQPEHHIVFDMGAGSTTATVLRFQGRSVKDIGRFNKTVQEVSVLGTGWDRELGGDALNTVVVTDYLHKFLTKPVLKNRGVRLEEVKQNGRLMSRVWKEAEKVRQVLSANTETSSSFEELLPDVDFRTKLTRTEFEKLTEDFANRVSQPIEDALAAAKLEIAQIDSIILHGGAVRAPFVQRKLEQIVGSSAKLKSNVNADESAVFGAAFKAAALSPSFKVKEIRSSDHAGYPAGLIYPDEAGKERSQILFTPTSPAGNNGSTKQVSFKNKDDFSFSFFQKIDGVEKSFADFSASNLTASVKALQDKFGCEKADITTKFSIRLSPVNGLPEVVSGSVSCETDGSVKSSVGNSVKDWLGLGKKKDQQPLSDDDEAAGPTEDVEASASGTSTSDGSATSSASASASSSKVPEKPKKRTETINLSFSSSTSGVSKAKSESLQSKRDRLAAFDRSDKARYAREEALNILESYTYYVRDFLSNTDFASFSTDAQRDTISKALQITRDFMEQPAEMAKATEKIFKEKLNDLKSLVTPIQQRRTETEGRPEKLKGLRASLEQTDTLLNMVQEQVEQAKAAYSSSLLSEASSATSSASEEAATSLSKDDLDDLEEPDLTTSQTESKAPKPSSPPTFSPYTDSDLTSVRQVYDDVSRWLEEKEAEQAKLKPFEDPAFTVKDIEKKAGLLSDAMMDVLQKKMRTPPKSSSSKKPKSSKTKTPKKGKSSSTDGSASSATDAPSAKESTSVEPDFATVVSDDDVPSDEEIQRLVSQVREKEKGRFKHDEL